MKKRIFSLLLSLSLFVSLFAGCDTISGSSSAPAGSEPTSSIGGEEKLESYNDYINSGYISFAITDANITVFYKYSCDDGKITVNARVYSVSSKSFITEHYTNTQSAEEPSFCIVKNEEMMINVIYSESAGGCVVEYLPSRPVHTHSFTEGYVSDGGKHMAKCSCGEMDYPELCSLGDFKSDDKNHWQTCSVCGFTAKSAHTVVNGKCTVCNKTFDTESKGLEFAEVSGGYAVISLGSCTDKNLHIPSTHNGKPVVAIGGFAFAGTDIESVYIPESVTEIGAFAFSNCTKLKGELVIRRSGNVIISESAFTGCSSLTKLTVASHFSEILADAFSHCTGLKEIHFDNPFVSSFDIHTFAYCSSLEKIKVGGLYEDWIIIFENSVGGEGELEDLSWYANSGNFVIKFDDGSTMTKSELIALYSFE